MNIESSMVVTGYSGHQDSAGLKGPAPWCRKPRVRPTIPSVSALQSRPRRPAGTAGKKRKSSRQPGMNEEFVTGQKQPGATSLNPVCHAALQTRLKTCRLAAQREAAPKSRYSTDGKEKSWPHHHRHHQQRRVFPLHPQRPTKEQRG